MKAVRKDGIKFFGERGSVEYEIKDDSAEYFLTYGNMYEAEIIVEKVLSNEELWDNDLSTLPGFLQAVKQQLTSMINNGVLQTVAPLQLKKVTV